MSLETTIATLVTASNNLTAVVAGKMSEIDGKVNAAVIAVPVAIDKRMSRSMFVDPVKGNNANSGESAALAKATIAAAISGVPSGASVNVYLASGVTHSIADKEIDCTNKVVTIYGLGHSVGDASTYVEVRSEPYVFPDGTLGGYGFNVGVGGWLQMMGCRLSTVKFGAEHTGKSQPLWQTAYLKTNSSNGKYQLQHCQVDIYHGSLCYQHSAGSIGLADLIMRTVRINKISLAGYPVTVGNQFLMGTYGNMPIPFNLFGVDLVRQGAATWAELINQDMTNARTNIKD